MFQGKKWYSAKKCIGLGFSGKLHSLLLSHKSRLVWESPFVTKVIAQQQHLLPEREKE